MKHLNRIIFIKSANVDYQEIQLNGNVHFTGDQGVGKTTVLRAILFFYNADTQRLGIPRVANKSDFADYYFEFPNSHLIYEVVNGLGKYTIWLYKEHNKLSYRFIDSEYKKAFFISETPKGFLPLKPLQVQEEIVKQTRYSKKINRFSEYLNILYGANNRENGIGRTFKPYAIMESPAFQNIPKTISNIYLNSNLKSDAIKTTIINSISADDYLVNEGKGYKVDLNVLRSQLSDFKQDYNDISAYERIKKKGETIIKSYDNLIILEQDKILAAKTLGANYRELDGKIKKLTFNSENLAIKLKGFKNELQVLQEEFNGRKADYDKKITIEKQNQDIARQKINQYKTINKENLQGIDKILEFAGKEKSFESEKENLERELRLLTSEVESVEEKYKSILQQLKNSHDANLNILREKKSEIKEKLASRRTLMVEQYAEIIEGLRTQFDKQLERETEVQNQLYKKETDLKRQRDKIKETRFFEEEIKNEELILSECKDSISKSENKNRLLKKEIEQLQDNGNHEKVTLRLQFENRKKELEKEQKDFQAKLDEFDEKIKSFKDSFQEFLIENYPNWEETIGKVCDERILLSQALSPKVTALSGSLYGVNLNLSEIDFKVKTISDYQKEKSHLQAKVEGIKKEFEKEQLELDNQEQKVNNKYNPKIKQKNQEILTAKAFIAQTERKGSQSTINIENLRKEAIGKKAEEIAKIDPLIKDVIYSFELSKNRYSALKAEKEKKVKEKQEEQKSEINKLISHYKQLEQNITSEEENEVKNYKEKAEQIQREKVKELEGKVDTVYLIKLETDIERFKKRLESIRKLNSVVAVYYEDKVNYLDKLPLFEANCARLIFERDGILEEYEKNKKILDGIIDKTGRELNSLKDELKEQEHQKVEFEQFKSSSFYKDVEYFIGHNEGIFNNVKLTALINKITNLHNDISISLIEMKNAINKFVSPFREGNIFNFPTHFTEDAEYRSFASDLKDFVSDNKIDDYKKYIKKNHSDLINLIVKHIEQLSSKKREIDEIISKMNKDFEKHNFVGVVQKVELRADPSENKIFQTFEQIRKFHAENPFGFGEQNLFTGMKLEENNDVAFKLLVDLMSNLEMEKNRTEISLENTFELKFKVVENNKDTGWQIKLADIGSNGTDVLVKAMLYIMLLNVLKEKASKKQSDFKLHCIMDEINIIHPKNINSLINFANERGIWMINGSPVETNALAYKYVYDFEKTKDSITHANRLIAQN